MPAWIERLKNQPWIQHFIRATQRFLDRLGNQFAAGITYFSVLAMIPILMVGFAGLGMTLTVLKPEWLDVVTDWITEQLSHSDSATVVIDIITDSLRNWRGIGVVALVLALYAGAGWMNNLRRAVNSMWRKVFDVSHAQANIVTRTLVNVALLLGLLILFGLTIAMSTVSFALTAQVADWLGLTDSPLTQWLLRLVTILAGVVTGWVLFAFMYRFLPDEPVEFRKVATGALFGSVGLVVLQFAASQLTSSFAQNRATVLFGPVIVIMLFFNLFAALILYGAAWTATGGDVPTAPLDVIAQDPGDGAPELAPVATTPMVTEDLARRGVSVGMGTGWVLGSAAGLGFGAVLGRVMAGMANRRIRRRDRRAARR